MTNAKQPKQDACAYLLTILLQRMEEKQPGLIQEMIDGVLGDRSAIPKDVIERKDVAAIFDEALNILNRAHQIEGH